MQIMSRQNRHELIWFGNHLQRHFEPWAPRGLLDGCGGTSGGGLREPANDFLGRSGPLWAAMSHSFLCSCSRPLCVALCCSPFFGASAPLPSPARSAKTTWEAARVSSWRQVPDVPNGKNSGERQDASASTKVRPKKWQFFWTAAQKEKKEKREKEAPKAPKAPLGAQRGQKEKTTGATTG